MSKMLLKELLDKKLKFKVQFTNLTSETSLEKIEIISVATNGCVLQLPVKSCTKGHQVRLRIFIPKLKKPLEIIGKILELESVNEKQLEAKVLFNQYIKEEWLGLLDMLDLDQKMIDKIIKKLKES